MNFSRENEARQRKPESSSVNLKKCRDENDAQNLNIVYHRVPCSGSFSASLGHFVDLELFISCISPI